MPLGKKISPKKTAEKKNNSKGMKKRANPRDTPESIKWKDKHYRYRKKIRAPGLDYAGVTQLSSRDWVRQMCITSPKTMATDRL